MPEKVSKKARKPGREEAKEAVRSVATAGGWADACVFDGSAMMFSTKGDLPEEAIAQLQGTTFKVLSSQV